MSVTTMASGGTTPAQMATDIRDMGSQYTIVGTPTVVFNSTSGSATTDNRAIGTFAGGTIAAGTSLSDPVDPTAVFAGGINIASGVCLGTGFLSDNEPTSPSGIPDALRVGVQGANNGFPIDSTLQPNHEGEVSKILRAIPRIDVDFNALFASQLTPGGDASVLQFDIQLSSPGFLRVSFVFGSDESPFWVSQFNDTFAILVKGPCTPSATPGENLAKFVRQGVVENFTLIALRDCPPLFLKNQMSPHSLQQYPDSLHKIPGGAPYYDHEFGGFSTVLTRETAKPLAPGRYTIKFVIDDVADSKVDSALFIPAGSLKLFALNPGDYNGDGRVDTGDYVVWRKGFDAVPPINPATFYDGDGNGNCIVDSTDYYMVDS
ncbi:MAG: choice-of-anchor L domain-containing protein [Planctomycetes bacterium]|nr:choice-of-anchor L domain-containing protein [Planctomycetota bacterium]